MKKIMLFVLALCLCFIVFGGSAFADTAAAEAPAAEKPAEELYQAGKEALEAEDYGKALEYFQLAADLGNEAGLRAVGNLYYYGLGVELTYDQAMEYYTPTEEDQAHLEAVLGGRLSAKIILFIFE